MIVNNIDVLEGETMYLQKPLVMQSGKTYELNTS